MTGRPGAVEFFSGIGAFAYAARKRKIEVLAAFDQDESANLTYEHNFGLRPHRRNLDTAGRDDILRSDIWWMSPPCTPFSVRGKKRDLDDERTRSFSNLIALLPHFLPRAVFIENVVGFETSFACARARSVFFQSGYQVETVRLCPFDFKVPMLRPRSFMVATAGGANFMMRRPEPDGRSALHEYLSPDFAASYESDLEIETETVEKYGRSLHVVDGLDESAYVTCFTRGYFKCMKASGSYLLLPSGKVRRFSPDEILRLMGFGADFCFPPSIPLKAKLRLAGNSVDVRAISHLLDCLDL